MRTALWLLAMHAAGCATAPPFAGPLPVRNQHPAQLTVLHMDPVSAAALPATRARVRVDAAHSSYWLSRTGGGNSFEMDGELTRAALKTRVGLGHGLELALAVPVAHASGGFLDAFLIEYHELFGFPDQGREAAPRNRWQVQAQREGNTVLDMPEESLELLDLPVELRWTFLPPTAQRPFGAAVRAAVEFPTGDQDEGFGNGEVDWAVGLVGELRQDFVSVSAHVQHTFAGTPDRARLGGLEYRDVTSAGVGTEIWLSDGFAVLVQAEWESSTLRDLHFAEVSDPQVLLWTGVRARLAPRVSLEAAFAEDLVPDVSPDFTAYLAVAFDLGGAVP